jgi:hypothetical protein
VNTEPLDTLCSQVEPKEYEYDVDGRQSGDLPSIDSGLKKGINGDLNEIEEIICRMGSFASLA